MVTAEDIIHLNGNLEARLRTHMDAADVTPELINLVRAAIAAHEHAFHWAENLKEALLAPVERAWDAGAAKTGFSMAQGFASVSGYACALNLARGVAAAHAQAFFWPGMSKDAFMQFVSRAWDAGRYQRQVNAMEIEGSINNELGVALNFACHLALFGRREGLLSPVEAHAA